MNRGKSVVPTSSLYVGNLHHSVTEAILFEKFSVVGPIHFIHVCKHQETQLPLGYGYVTFESTEHAETAMDVMNFDIVKGEMIRLLWTRSVPSLPKTSVEDTVKTLKKHVHKRDIFELFKLFKNILNSSSSSGESEDDCAKKFVLPKAPLNNDLKKDLSNVEKNDVSVNNCVPSPFNSTSNCASKKTENLIRLDEVRRNLCRCLDVTLEKVKSIRPDILTTDITHETCHVASNLIPNGSDEHLEDEGYQTIDENVLSIESNECKERCPLNSVSTHVVNSNSSPAHFATTQLANVGTSNVVKSLNDEVESGRTNSIRFVPQRLREINSHIERVFRNVYVKNFGNEMNDEDLFELFHEFGPIFNCEIMRNEHGLSRGFGFVYFERPQSAKQAVDALNGKMLRNGKQIYVSRAQKKDDRILQLKKSFENKTSVRQYQGTNLYVKNLDDSMDDSQLHDIFSQFGTITSAKVMKEQNHSKGFGFVCFSTPTEATKAVTKMNGTIVGSKPLYVALAQRKEDRQAHLASQCIQLLANLRKPEKEQKDQNSDVEPLTFEDILSESTQVIPELDDLLPGTPSSVVSNITDSLSNGEVGPRIPYQLEHLPNPVPFPLAGLPKRKIGHHQIGLGHSRGPARHSVNATNPSANVSPQRSTQTLTTDPTMARFNGSEVPERYEPRMDYRYLYTYHENDPSFKQYGIGREMIPHSNQYYNMPGIR